MKDDQDLKEREAEFYRRLQEQGLWIPRGEQAPAPTCAHFEPIPIKGKPLSQTILEDRD